MSGAPSRLALGRAGATLAAGAIASRLLQALAYALLARELPPTAFGTLALAAVATNALQLLPGLGLGTALLCATGDPRPAARSAVTTALLGGAGVAMLAGAIAWRLAVNGHADVAPLVALLGGALLFQSPGAIAGALLDRELRFGARVGADLAGGAAFLLVSLAAARAGAGALALALGLLAATAVTSLVALTAARLVPSAHPDFAALRPTARLGALVLASALLQWLFTSADLWTIERRFGREAVGCYTTALQLALLPASALGVLSGRLALPALVRARGGGGATAAGFRQASAAAALLAAAACALLVVAARPLVSLLYGARFAGAGELLPLVAVGAFAKVLGGLAGPALLAVGQARLAVALIALQVGVALPLAYATPAEFGAGGVAVVYSGVQAIACVAAFVVGAGQLALPAAAALRAGLLPLIAGLAPAVLLHWLLPATGPWLGLALGLVLIAQLAWREHRHWRRDVAA